MLLSCLTDSFYIVDEVDYFGLRVHNGKLFFFANGAKLAMIALNCQDCTYFLFKYTIHQIHRIILFLIDDFSVDFCGFYIGVSHQFADSIKVNT